MCELDRYHWINPISEVWNLCVDCWMSCVTIKDSPWGDSCNYSIDCQGATWVSIARSCWANISNTEVAIIDGTAPVTIALRSGEHIHCNVLQVVWENWIAWNDKSKYVTAIL